MTKLAVLAPLQRPRPLLFLDFEASGLSEESWPIELGYAWLEGAAVRSRSAIIAPRPEWRRDAWDAGAERIHAIPFEALATGRDADAVAAETDTFANYDVVSDNPVWDQRWLDRLRQGRPILRVGRLRDAVRARLDEGGAIAVAQALFRAAPAHRAEADAVRLAAAFAAGAAALPLAA